MHRSTEEKIKIFREKNKETISTSKQKHRKMLIEIYSNIWPSKSRGRRRKTAQELSNQISVVSIAEIDKSVFYVLCGIFCFAIKIDFVSSTPSSLGLNPNSHPQHPQHQYYPPTSLHHNHHHSQQLQNPSSQNLQMFNRHSQSFPQPSSSSSMYENSGRINIHSSNNNDNNGPRINYEMVLKKFINEIRSIFNKQHLSFDSFFRQTLKMSHADFHRMFSDTYGILYDRHSFIFNDMFHNLEKYYNDGSIDLDQSMREFFSILYKKMFEELNAQYAFDAVYLNCTVAHMEEMMPFGELPQKLILQVRRSFVAIRTFVQALKYGSDILKTIMELPITNSCENRLRQIGYCQQCSTSQSYHSNHNHHHQHSPYSQAQSRSSIGANSGTNPICQSSCVQTIERCCLSCRTHLNREWNKFLFEISRLASRLKTSFNIEHIVSPIHIQISDAIMNFQENGRTISQRLFNKCGRPMNRKREKRNEQNDYNLEEHRIPPPPSSSSSSSMPRKASTKSIIPQMSILQNNFQQQQQQQPHLQSNQGSQVLNIDNIIDFMSEDFKVLKNFWSQLPQNLCSSASYSNDEKHCVRNETIRSQDDSINYRDKNNVEIMNQQISTMKLISINLNNAYNGLDVDFENNFESEKAPIDDEISGSGESSGDGSGFIEEQNSENKNPVYQHSPSSNESSNSDISFVITPKNPSTNSDSSNQKENEEDGHVKNPKIIILDSKSFGHRQIDFNRNVLLTISIVSSSILFLIDLRLFAITP